MVKTEFHSDGHTEEFSINRVQDCQPLVEYAHAKRVAGETGTADLKLAAEFPLVVVERYMALAGIDWNEFMTNSAHAKRMLSDPDLKAFRIWEGRA